jgi:hypothetical protein
MSAPDQGTCGKMARKVNRAKDLTGLTVGRHGLGLTPTQVLIQTRTQALSDAFSLFTPSMSVERLSCRILASIQRSPPAPTSVDSVPTPASAPTNSKTDFFRVRAQGCVCLLRPGTLSTPARPLKSMSKLATSGLSIAASTSQLTSQSWMIDPALDLRQVSMPAAPTKQHDSASHNQVQHRCSS